MIFDKKNSKSADLPREKKKQMPTWFKSKVKIVAMMVVFALIWGIKRSRSISTKSS